MLSIIKESAKEVSRDSCHEAEVAGEGTDTCKSSFGSSDFGKLDMKIDESIDSNQFDNLDNSPEVFQVEKVFIQAILKRAKKKKMKVAMQYLKRLNLKMQLFLWNGEHKILLRKYMLRTVIMLRILVSVIYMTIGLKIS